MRCRVLRKFIFKLVLFWLTVFGALILLSAHPASAVDCSITLDKSVYFQLESPLATGLCPEANQKSKAYNVTWENGTEVFEEVLGTTPDTVDTNFFIPHTIPTTHTGNLTVIIRVVNSGDARAEADVTTGNANAIIISKPEFTENILISKTASLHIDLHDENGNEVNNAKCLFEILDSNNKVVQRVGPVTSNNGHCSVAGVLSPKTFFEGRAFSYRVHAQCGLANTSLACWDNSTIPKQITVSGGTASFSFPVGTYLIVHTGTDKSVYRMKDEIFVTASLTNVNGTGRLPVEIFHQARCSAGEDNPSDSDRALIFSDDDEPDHRGIDVGETQNQSKRFIIPESRYLQGRNSECVASTEVWVLNELEEKAFGYFTTSPVFNISSDELNLNPDWQRTDNYTWNTIVNLSALEYHDWNGSGIGNIDLRLHKDRHSTINPADQYGGDVHNLEAFIATENIKSVVATNLTGDILTTRLEVLDDGLIEIEIIGVPLDQSGWYNVTIVFHDFQERLTEATEQEEINLIPIALALLTLSFFYLSSKQEKDETTQGKEGIWSKYLDKKPIGFLYEMVGLLMATITAVIATESQRRASQAVTVTIWTFVSVMFLTVVYVIYDIFHNATKPADVWQDEDDFRIKLGQEGKKR